MRLHDRLHGAPDTDAVTAAEEGLGRAVFRDEGRVHLVRVVGPVREDVPDLHAALDAELSHRAPRTEIALAHIVGVDLLALEVPALYDVPKVSVPLVRARDVRAAIDRSIDQRAHSQPDRPDESWNRTRGGEVAVIREFDLGRSENLSELGLVDVAIARQHDRNQRALGVA